MENENKNENTELVGYVRLSNSGGAIKVSINKDALNACDTYKTSEGVEYVGLTISLARLMKIIEKEQAVTSLTYWKKE